MSIQAYQENLDVAGQALRAAVTRLELFKTQELVYRDEDKVVRCKTPEAAAAYCAWVKCNSDWEHWASRLRMAQTEAGQFVTVPTSFDARPVQQDFRLPTERDDEIIT